MAGSVLLALNAVAVVALVTFAHPAEGAEKGDNHVDFSVAQAAGEHGTVEGCHVVGLAPASTAEAHLMPGACGAEILCLGGDKGFDHVVLSSGGDTGDGDTSVDGTGDMALDRGNSHIDFRITIRPDGLVHVNGEELALCDPAEGCRISLAWSAAAGALAVQVRAADGALVAAQYHLASAPSELRVEAAEIRWLSVTPQ